MSREINKGKLVSIGLILVIVALFVAAIAISHQTPTRKSAHHHQGAQPTQAHTGPVAPPVPPALSTLARSWANLYAAYLNGAPAGTLGRLASDGGGRPSAGQHIKVTTVNVAYNVGQTSAPITVMAVGATGTKYPFTLTAPENSAAQWSVTAITPPDIAQDQTPTVTSASPADLPSPAAQAATKRFVLQYGNYQANHGPIPTGMSGSSGVQMQQGTDPLNGTLLAKGKITVVSAQFAPPSGSEFTATIRLRFHDGTLFDITVLMQGTGHGWVCAGFIGATNPGSAPASPA